MGLAQSTPPASHDENAGDGEMQPPTSELRNSTALDQDENVTDADPGHACTLATDESSVPIEMNELGALADDKYANPEQKPQVKKQPRRRTSSTIRSELVGKELDLQTQQAVRFNLRQIASRRSFMYWATSHPWLGITVLFLVFVLFLPLIVLVLLLFLTLLLLLKTCEPYCLVHLMPSLVLDFFGVPVPIGKGQQLDVDTSPVEDVTHIRDALDSTMIFESKALPFEGYPLNLDVGIYWFGTGGTKCSKGPSSEYFDKAKPSVVYVHGWEIDAITRGYRESINWRVFNPEHNKVFHRLSEQANCIDLWIAKGWNVGIFYWDQFSDEPTVFAAERKIYNSEKMRWRKQRGDGTTVYVSAKDLNNGKCAADFLVDSYCEHFKRGWDAFKDVKSPAVHLVGHSLGTQLALECCRRLVVSENALASSAGERVWLPDRLVLLDPFFSYGRKSFAPFFKATVSERVSATLSILLDLPFDIPVQTYTTSIIGMGLLGGRGARLRTHTDYNEHFAACAAWTYVDFHHVVAPHLYFSSLIDSEVDKTLQRQKQSQIIGAEDLAQDDTPAEHKECTLDIKTYSESQQVRNGALSPPNPGPALSSTAKPVSVKALQPGSEVRANMKARKSGRFLTQNEAARPSDLGNDSAVAIV